MIRKILTPRSSIDAWARTLSAIAVLGGTLFLMWQSEERPLSGSGAEQLRGPSEPDSFVVDGRYRAWDESGKLEMQLTSPRIEQFEPTNRAHLQAPVAQLYGEQSPQPWIIEADTGSLLQEQGLLQLQGNVAIRQASESRSATLETQALTLDDTAGTLYTDEPVTITEPFGVTRATGMKAWIDERILELNSRVEGRYEPRR